MRLNERFRTPGGQQRSHQLRMWEIGWPLFSCPFHSTTKIRRCCVRPVCTRKVKQGNIKQCIWEKQALSFTNRFPKDLMTGFEREMFEGDSGHEEQERVPSVWFSTIQALRSEIVENNRSHRGQEGSPQTVGFEFVRFFQCCFPVLLRLQKNHSSVARGSCATMLTRILGVAPRVPCSLLSAQNLAIAYKNQSRFYAQG